MSPEQKVLVQTSWRILSPQAESVAHIFYHRLFTTTPATRAMFAHVDPAAQAEKLIAALSTVANGIYELDSLAPALSALGKRHASYGVTDDQYDAVGAALLWTLETVLAAKWTAEVNLAWSEAYSTVAHVMRTSGSQSHSSIGGNPSGQSNYQEA